MNHNKHSYTVAALKWAAVFAPLALLFIAAHKALS